MKKSFAGGGAAWPLIVLTFAVIACAAISLLAAVLK
jgi:hypothetical protein